MQKTYKQIEDFVTTASSRLAIAAKELNGAKTPFTHALERMVSRLRPQLEQLRERREDLAVTYCALAPDGTLRRDQHGFLFTRDDQRAYTAAVRELGAEVVTIDPYLQAIPVELTEYERDVYGGFLVDPEGTWQGDAPLRLTLADTH